MQVFTASQSEINNLTLSEEESKHCVRVLRKSNSDSIFITDGAGKLYTAEITEAHQKHCKFKITNTENQKLIAPPLHIAIAPTKNIDRFEFFLEKATEIGIAQITPLKSFHSERKNVKMDRLHKIIIAACKQSKNFHFPTLNELTPFQEVLQMNVEQRLIAHCEEKDKIELKSLNFQKETLLLIGPEGDFSSEEIKQALQAGFQPISLGESRLRTETAGIVACTTVNLNYER